MKRSISILLCIVLIFSSFSFAFAQDWSATDSNNLSNIRASVMSGGQLYNLVSACNTTLNNLNYNLVTLMGWLDPSTGGSTTALLNQILNALVYTNVGGATVSFLNDLRTENLIQSNKLGNIELYEQFIQSMFAGSTNPQGYFNYEDLSVGVYTPASFALGVYNWLFNIQNPLAHLAYVIASPERIAAQEAAAANEEAVVDNFIDSTGDGAVPTSSFSDVSGLSSGVTSNLSTDASPAQIWDIFNSDHGSWFSQETANQLDTTTRTRGSEFETPLLDQQMEEIYKSLGGGK